MTDSISAHKTSAVEYDRLCRAYEWHGHEIIYGLCHEYLAPSKKLLDVGIGTGISSELFAKAGMEVTGIDGSQEMLQQCEPKRFAYKLIQYDITKTPWPLESNTFDIAISVGVLHFFLDLDPVIEEISRLTKENGIIAFPVVDPNESGSMKYSHPVKRNIQSTNVYSHPLIYVNEILNKHGLDKLKQVGFLSKTSPDGENELLYRAIVAQKKNS